jgi:hypothetical protein
MMRRTLLVALALAATAPAFAAEPSGCDKFKWPIERERAALTAPDRSTLASAADVTGHPPIGWTLTLRPSAEAALPSPPERAPAASTFAGFVNVKSPWTAGIYTISLSAGAWVDVVQDGKHLKPKAFSGATDCNGIRKTMKFDLTAAPFVIQISGAKENAIALAILQSE